MAGTGLRGLAIIRLDEYTVDRDSAKITGAFFTKGKEKAEATYVEFTARGEYGIKQLASVGLPKGKCERGDKIMVAVSYRNLKPWVGKTKDGRSFVKLYADIDGPVFLIQDAEGEDNDRGSRDSRSDDRDRDRDDRPPRRREEDSEPPARGRGRRDEEEPEEREPSWSPRRSTRRDDMYE
jgi:hypothetical protein